VVIERTGATGTKVAAVSTPYAETAADLPTQVSAEGATLVVGSDASGEPIALTLQLSTETIATVSSRETAAAILWLGIGGHGQYLFATDAQAKATLMREPEFESLVAAIEKAVQGGQSAFSAPEIPAIVEAVARRQLTAYAATRSQQKLLLRGIPTQYYYGNGFIGEFLALKADEKGASIHNLFKTNWRGSVTSTNGGAPSEFPIAAKDLLSFADFDVFQPIRAAETKLTLPSGMLKIAVFQNEISRRDNINKVIKAAVNISLGEAFKGDAVEKLMGCFTGVNGSLNTTTERLASLANGEQFFQQAKEFLESLLSPSGLNTVAACAGVGPEDLATTSFLGKWTGKLMSVWAKVELAIFTAESASAIKDIAVYYNAREERTFCAWGNTAIGETCNTDAPVKLNSTVESVQREPTIESSFACGVNNAFQCKATMYCTPPDEAGSSREDTVQVNLDAATGRATLSWDGDTLMGPYTFESGSLSVSVNFPMREVTPQGSSVRFYSSGSMSLTGTYNPAAGTFSGTLTDKVTTHWALDARQVSCTSTSKVTGLEL
jgi:hypothetical protein